MKTSFVEVKMATTTKKKNQEYEKGIEINK